MAGTSYPLRAVGFTLMRSVLLIYLLFCVVFLFCFSSFCVLCTQCSKYLSDCPYLIDPSVFSTVYLMRSRHPLHSWHINFSMRVTYLLHHTCDVFTSPYVWRIYFSIRVTYLLLHTCDVFTSPYVWRIYFTTCMTIWLIYRWDILNSPYIWHIDHSVSMTYWLFHRCDIYNFPYMWRIDFSVGVIYWLLFL